MGARVTKNISSDQGSEISGCRYRLIKEIHIDDVRGYHFKHGRYYVDKPTAKSFRFTDDNKMVLIEKPLIKDAIIYVKNVYHGYNFPDVGYFVNITGTIITNEKIWEGVSLNSLFLPYPNHKDVDKYHPNPEYLEEINKDRNEVDDITIPVIKNSYENLLKSYKAIRHITSPAVPVMNKHMQDLKLTTEEVCLILSMEDDPLLKYSDECTEEEKIQRCWKLDKALQQIYCNFTHDKFEKQYLKYEE